MSTQIWLETATASGRVWRKSRAGTSSAGSNTEVVNDDRRLSDPPLGKCQDVAAPPAGPHLCRGRRLAGDGGSRGRCGSASSAEHAGREGQRASGRRGAPASGQVLHSGALRLAGQRSTGYRQELAATTGYARFPFHVQSAASEELVVRRFAR